MEGYDWMDGSYGMETSQCVWINRGECQGLLCGDLISNLENSSLNCQLY